jgi:hypothetical protein
MLENMRAEWIALENRLVQFILVTNPMVHLPMQTPPKLPSAVTRYHKYHEEKGLLIEAATNAQPLFRILIARASFNILALQYCDNLRDAAKVAVASHGGSRSRDSNTAHSMPPTQDNAKEVGSEQEKELPWEEEVNAKGFPYAVLDDFMNSACGDWDIRRRGGIMVAELATDDVMKMMSMMK